MDGFYSYAVQTQHYFRRVHEGPARSPLKTPAAWRSSDPTSLGKWRVSLAPRHVDELHAALATAKKSGRPTGELSADDFPLPTLSGEIARWRETLASGRGFQVVSGVPVADWSREDTELVYWCLGLHMGRPGAQNPQGDLLGHVFDTGDDADDPFVRLYRTRSHIAYHCDAADIVGLLCLRSALRGGTSRIVSSVTVYNELLARRPDLAERLYETFHLDIRNEDSSGALRHLPIPPCRFDGARLRTFYHSDYFRSVVRHDDIPAFSGDELALLNLYEEIAARPDLYVDMDLAPGDIQWLSNHTILHARSGYEDHAEPEQRRHLLRLWLSL